MAPYTTGMAQSCLLQTQRLHSNYLHECCEEKRCRAASVPLIDLEAAESAISSIPQAAVDSAASEVEAAEVSPKEALEQLKREQELVEEERELLQSKASNERAFAASEEEHRQRLSREQLHDIADALETMSSESAISREREEVTALENERLAHREQVEEAAGTASDIAMLDSRVKKMIESIRDEVEQANKDMGQSFRQLDLDSDGVISYEELMLAMESINVSKRPHAAQLKEVLQQLDPDADGKVSVAHLRSLVLDMEMKDDFLERKT